MPLEPISENQVPPGGWRWLHPETGRLIHANGWSGLKSAARLFLSHNGFPIPADLDDHMLNWMNKDIQEKAAAKGLPPVPFLQATTAPDLVTRAYSFAHAAKEWIRNGLPVLNREEVEARIEICRTCGYWKGESSPFHVACGKCGCTGLKLWMRTSRCPIGRWEMVAGSG
jgi:hypothetical protein